MCGIIMLIQHAIVTLYLFLILSFFVAQQHCLVQNNSRVNLAFKVFFLCGHNFPLKIDHWYFRMMKEQLFCAPLYMLTSDQKEACRKLQAAKWQAALQIAHGHVESYQQWEKSYKSRSRKKVKMIIFLCKFCI